VAQRHAWTKLRIHVYVCRRCGTGKENEQRGVEWVTTYHRSDGSSVESARVPPCDVGPNTGLYLMLASWALEAPPDAAEEET
jgi:hypothetical protein